MTEERQGNRKARCMAELRARILTEDLQPGAYLDETELAAQYEMSRPPLREALRQLSGEGYLVLHENRGAQVAPMTYRTMRNFFIVAPMIYSAVSRLAAENATPAQIARLNAAQARLRAAMAEGDAAARALTNERFHAIIGEMADNEFLTPSLRRLLIDHTRISMTFYNPRNDRLADARETAVAQHDRFIEAIEAGDGDRAAALAIAHWDLSRAEIEAFVAPASIDIPLGPRPNATAGRATA